MPATPATSRLSGAAVLVLLVLTLLTAGLTGPAYAERVIHRDARHDVRLTRDDRPHDVAAPRRREPDIRRIRIAYTATALKLRVHVESLRPRSNHAALVQIRTPDYTAGVYVTRIPSEDLESVTLIRGYGELVDCPGLIYRMYWRADVVRVVVPRTCLDQARWVRAGFALSRTTTHRAYSDDALRRGGSVAALTRRLHAG